MAWLTFPLIAFAPGLFWLWFYARLDRYHPAPRRLIAWSFFLGVVSTIPVGIIYAIVGLEDWYYPGAPLTLTAVVMFGIVGPVEETCKFLAVRWFAYRSRWFEEPMDGLVFGAAASLGFASLENLGYVLLYGPWVMIARAPLSTVGHLIFGSLWGHALGLRHEGASAGIVWRGLTLAALLHGLYNVSTDVPPYFLWAPLIILIGGILAYRRFRRTENASPFRYRRNVPLIVCRSCSEETRVANRYCHSCGTPVAVSPTAIMVCGNCRRAAPPSTYCGGCGDRLLY